MDYKTIKTIEELRSLNSRYRQPLQGPLTLEMTQKWFEFFKGRTHPNGQLMFPEIQIIRQGEGYNFAYLNLPLEPWNPTGKPELDKVIDRFCTAVTNLPEKQCVLYSGSTHGPWHEDSDWQKLGDALPESFEYQAEWASGYVYGWVSEELLTISLYVEGDALLYVFQDAESFANGLEEERRTRQ